MSKPWLNSTKPAFAISVARSAKATCRPPLERMALIARWLRQGRRLTCGKVAEAMEVSRKTIWRDIEFMRDRLGYQIEWRQEGIAKEDCSFIGRPPKERIL